MASMSVDTGGDAPDGQKVSQPLGEHRTQSNMCAAGDFTTSTQQRLGSVRSKLSTADSDLNTYRV
eukprot:3190783-Pleurochrysis_carterae.AAC.2